MPWSHYFGHTVTCGWEEEPFPPEQLARFRGLWDFFVLFFFCSYILKTSPWYKKRVLTVMSGVRVRLELGSAGVHENKD